MPLPSPNLDDRDFRQLVEEARRHIIQSCPGWTDLSPGDPGIVLLELFAHLTETMIYRLNRVPDKMYIEFLRLIGTRMQPPAAASVSLLFSRARAEDQSISIPRGTRVTVSRSSGASDALVFTTAANATIPAGATQVEVLAHHCDLVEGEFAGTGTGLPNLVVKVQRPPIVSATGDELDLFTVSNTTVRAVRGRAHLVAEQATAASWLTLLGEAERDFASTGSHQFVVQITLPPGAPAGDYTFRLDMVDECGP